MIQRGPSTRLRNLKIRERRKLLQVLESAISIAISMTPFGLVAFSTFSGA